MDPSLSDQKSLPSRRVALVGPSYPFRGGIAHFVDRLNRELAAAGHRTLVVTFRRQYPEILFPGKSQLESPPLEGAPKAGSNGAALRVIDSVNPLSWRRAASVIARDGCDVAVMNHWLPFFAPAFGTIARRLGAKHIPTITIVHNARPHEQHLGDQVLTRYFLSASDRLVSLSAEVQAHLYADFALESVMIPHPLYDQFGEAPDRAVARDMLGLPPNAPVLLFFGFVRRYKGLDILIDAMPRIVSEIPNALLVVAGEFYDAPEPYRESVARYGLQNHIRFDDMYVPNDRVPNYFAAADVVVQPYRTATQSGVAQIAFNYLVPVITTNVGGLSEIVRDGVNGLVIDAPESELLSEAVIRYFRDVMQPSMVQAIAATVGERSWRTLVNEIEKL